MNGIFGQLFVSVLGLLLAIPVASQNVITFAPDPLIGEFVRSSVSFPLYAGPGTQFERVVAPAVEQGRRVRIVAATADRRWYRVRWRETRASEPFAGWAEASHFIVRGRKSEVGESLRDERRAARAERREEAATTGTEIGGIRAERERQRVALDRIREKTEALKQAEDRERETAERERVERERQEAAERAARAARQQAETIRVSLVALYGGCFLLLLLPLYRAYIEYRVRHWREWSYSGAIALSGLCGLSAAAMAWGGGAADHPQLVLAAGLLGLPAWFFVPGALWLFAAFLASLCIPHPLEATFQRVLRGEPVTAAEAAKMAEAMYSAKRDGLPADWRVKSRVWRLERLAALLEKERYFAEKLTENATKPSASRR